jgi:hypothetical protein
MVLCFFVGRVFVFFFVFCVLVVFLCFWGGCGVVGFVVFVVCLHINFGYICVLFVKYAIWYLGCFDALFISSTEGIVVFIIALCNVLSIKSLIVVWAFLRISEKLGFIKLDKFVVLFIGCKELRLLNGGVFKFCIGSFVLVFGSKRRFIAGFGGMVVMVVTTVCGIMIALDDSLPYGGAFHAIYGGAIGAVVGGLLWGLLLRKSHEMRRRMEGCHPMQS